MGEGGGCLPGRVDGGGGVDAGEGGVWCTWCKGDIWIQYM